MDDPVVALPIRSFRDAYRRLAGAHDPDFRALLARELASRTARVVQATGPSPLIVSSAPEVKTWASKLGLVTLDDPPGGGLNSAAAEAVRFAGDRPWLILHADLPCLVPAEVSNVLELVRSGRHVVAFSYDGGTSALGGSGEFPFSYGVASFQRHLSADHFPVVVGSVGFALDIDRPGDLVAAASDPRGAWLIDRGLAPKVHTGGSHYSGRVLVGKEQNY